MRVYYNVYIHTRDMGQRWCGSLPKNRFINVSLSYSRVLPGEINRTPGVNLPAISVFLRARYASRARCV